MKRIYVQEDTWKDLNLMKYALAVDNIDQVIIKLILNYKTQAEGEQDGSNI